MSFKEAFEYISSLQMRGIVPGLENIKKLCEKLRDPQDGIKTIHIAGTNGKGSTGTYICRILERSGFRVGRYASPAVEEYREIFSVNGDYISEADYIECISHVKTACDELEKEGVFPTSFEAETALAFLYFRLKNCDYAVIECGMGGRFDATNVIKKPEVCVITSVTEDHTDFLGESIEKIAYHKAGIIKNGCNAVTINQNKEVIDVIEKECALTGSDLHIAKKADIIKSSIDGIDFLYDSLPLHTSMSGLYQADNASLAVCAVKCLNADISDIAIQNGIADSVWKYRFEVSGENPYWIFDGAHNADGVKSLVKTLSTYFPKKKLVFIFGMFKNKDYKSVSEEIASVADFVYTVSPSGERGLDAEILADEVRKYNKNVVALKDIKQAVKLCENHNCHAVVCCGSLSFLAQIKKEKGLI